MGEDFKMKPEQNTTGDVFNGGSRSLRTRHCLQQDYDASATVIGSTDTDNWAYPMSALSSGNSCEARPGFCEFCIKEQKNDTDSLTTEFFIKLWKQ